MPITKENALKKLADELIDVTSDPQSFETMEYPVLLSSGETYEESLIQIWLKNDRVDLNRQPVVHQVWRNQALKQIVDVLRGPAKPTEAIAVPTRLDLSIFDDDAEEADNADSINLSELNQSITELKLTDECLLALETLLINPKTKKFYDAPYQDTQDLECKLIDLPGYDFHAQQCAPFQSVSIKFIPNRIIRTIIIAYSQYLEATDPVKLMRLLPHNEANDRYRRALEEKIAAENRIKVLTEQYQNLQTSLTQAQEALQLSEQQREGIAALLREKKLAFDQQIREIEEQTRTTARTTEYALWENQLDNLCENIQRSLVDNPATNQFRLTEFIALLQQKNFVTAYQLLADENQRYNGLFETLASQNLSQVINLILNLLKHQINCPNAAFVLQKAYLNKLFFLGDPQKDFLRNYFCRFRELDTPTEFIKFLIEKKLITRDELLSFLLSPFNQDYFLLRDSFKYGLGTIHCMQILRIAHRTGLFKRRELLRCFLQADDTHRENMMHEAAQYQEKFTRLLYQLDFLLAKRVFLIQDIFDIFSSQDSLGSTPLHVYEHKKHSLQPILIFFQRLLRCAPRFTQQCFDLWTQYCDHKNTSALDLCDPEQAKELFNFAVNLCQSGHLPASNLRILFSIKTRGTVHSYAFVDAMSPSLWLPVLAHLLQYGVFSPQEVYEFFAFPRGDREASFWLYIAHRFPQLDELQNVLDFLANYLPQYLAIMLNLVCNPRNYTPLLTSSRQETPDMLNMLLTFIDAQLEKRILYPQDLESLLSARISQSNSTILKAAKDDNGSLQLIIDFIFQQSIKGRIADQFIVDLLINSANRASLLVERINDSFLRFPNISAYLRDELVGRRFLTISRTARCAQDSRKRELYYGDRSAPFHHGARRPAIGDDNSTRPEQTLTRGSNGLGYYRR